MKDGPEEVGFADKTSIATSDRRTPKDNRDRQFNSGDEPFHPSLYQVTKRFCRVLHLPCRAISFQIGKDRGETQFAHPICHDHPCVVARHHPDIRGDFTEYELTDPTQRCEPAARQVDLKVRICHGVRPRHSYFAIWLWIRLLSTAFRDCGIRLGSFPAATQKAAPRRKQTASHLALIRLAAASWMTSGRWSCDKISALLTAASLPCLRQQHPMPLQRVCLIDRVIWCHLPAEAPEKPFNRLDH